MKLSKFINVPIFITSLFIGLCAVYFVNNEKRKIIVYPNSDNIEKIQYKDSSGTCYKIKETQINCPINKKDISKFEVQ